jgi:hypothetical protein
LIKYNVFNWCGNAQSKGLGVFAWLFIIFRLW